MKIAVVQMHYPKGHRRLDQEYVKILSQDHEIIIVDDGKYFPEQFCSEVGVKRLRVHPFMIKRWERLKRLLHYINLISVLLSLKLRREKYDAILFLNIHSSLYFVTKWLPKKKTILFHHQDIDDMLAYPMYKNRFQSVKNNFLHICLADFISEGLVSSAGVDPNKVFTVHQPLVFNPSIPDEKTIKENLLIGIGNSTDEDVIKELIEFDKKITNGENQNKLVLRSKYFEYQGNVIAVIKGYLSREEYEALYTRSKVSIVMYPKQYRLRYSGIIDDSLAKQLVVFSNDSPCSQYFSSKYPNNVRVFKNTEELWKMSLSALPKSDYLENLTFVNNHNEDAIRVQLNSVLNS